VSGCSGLGCGSGRDRVVGYLPNIPETLVAFLATASLGAYLGGVPAGVRPARAVIDRFAMLEPKVMLAVAGYRYGDRAIDRRAEVATLRRRARASSTSCTWPYGGGADDELPATLAWDGLLAEAGALRVRAGAVRPSAVGPVLLGHHGFAQGDRARARGIVVEHFKNHGLSWDLRPGDRLMWFTTTAWMMWNALASSLLLRASIVMLDGNPAIPIRAAVAAARAAAPDPDGHQSALLMACRKAGVSLRDHDTSSIRQLCVAGSPLAPRV